MLSLTFIILKIPLKNFCISDIYIFVYKYMEALVLETLSLIYTPTKQLYAWWYQVVGLKCSRL